MPDMTLEQYFDRYGANMAELVEALVERAENLSTEQCQQLAQIFQSDSKSAAQSNLLNLVEEAQQNLTLAKKLRESIMSKNGEILGTVGDVTKTLMAVDKCLDGASKRFSTIYSIHSMQALEDSVKETLQEMDQDTYERIMALFEDKLKDVR